ncbi:MAG: hypothetical protein JSV16_11580 [Candidatus Hydrogenedentota bacterium]|nr:MAG: hypothetical protein JSV16_11580 [Candidatus Hydrogenedentota bacterium]
MSQSAEWVFAEKRFYDAKTEEIAVRTISLRFSGKEGLDIPLPVRKIDRIVALAIKTVARLTTASRVCFGTAPATQTAGWGAH